METPVPPSTTPALEALAERIARRDLPPPVADPYAPQQITKRLLEALKPLVPGRNRRGRLKQAWMLHRFFSHETQTADDLAEAAGIYRVAGSRAHTGLVQAGLLRWQRIGPRRVFRLTRWGEDWLLAVGRNEVPPARPAQ